MTDFESYPPVPENQDHGHTTPRVVFAMVGGALAVNLAAALHGNTYEDIAAGVIGGGAAVAFKERIENARASLYYWTSKKLGTEPNPTDLD